MKNTNKMARYMMMQNARQVDDRFRDRRGREHYDNGRYAPMRNGYDNDIEMRYRGEYPRRILDEGGGYIESMHDDDNRDSDWKNDTRVIGFAAAAKNHSASPMTREMADEWMSNIRNEDGSRGAHWTLEEVKRVMSQKGIECDPVKLWVAMNAEYSDRQAVNKKYGVDKLDFYVDSAIAYWLQDKDAVKDKLSAYYTNVVKH